MRRHLRLGCLAAAFTMLAGGHSAVAQETFPEPERCPRFIAEGPEGHLPVLRASFAVAQAERPTVRISYEGHSTFLIESPAGVAIATDYNDGVHLPRVPTIATMNIAHISHYSVAPNPEIEFVLPGWGETEAEPASYDLTVRDVWLRNVTTNIRGGGGFGFGFDDNAGPVRRDMNSIFVFEVAGLCIAHLGHLHQRLTADHLDALGRIDVVLVPVDGGRTLRVDSMLDVLRDIQAPVIIPMHFFGQATLSRFIIGLEQYYDVKQSLGTSVRLNRDLLPPVPTMMILQPG